MLFASAAVPLIFLYNYREVQKDHQLLLMIELFLLIVPVFLLGLH